MKYEDSVIGGIFDLGSPRESTLMDDYLASPEKFEELLTFYDTLLAKLKEELSGFEILDYIEKKDPNLFEMMKIGSTSWMGKNLIDTLKKRAFKAGKNPLKIYAKEIDCLELLQKMAIGTKEVAEGLRNGTIRTAIGDFLASPVKFDELITFYATLITKLQEGFSGLEIYKLIETTNPYLYNYENDYEKMGIGKWKTGRQMIETLKRRAFKAGTEPLKIFANKKKTRYKTRFKGMISFLETLRDDAMVTKIQGLFFVKKKINENRDYKIFREIDSIDDLIEKERKRIIQKFKDSRQRKWEQYQRKQEEYQREWEKYLEKLRTMKPVNDKIWEQSQKEASKRNIKIQGSRIFDNIKVPENSDYDLLIVDDNSATIRLLTTYFESKDVTCKGFVSGAKALEELKHYIPKVVLLDIILPDIDGYEISKEIKSNPKLKDIAVIFIPSIPSFEVERHLTETKADGYILKPFNFSDFDGILELLNSLKRRKKFKKSEKGRNEEEEKVEYGKKLERTKKGFEDLLKQELKKHLSDKENEEIKSTIERYIRTLVYLKTEQIGVYPPTLHQIEKRIRSDFLIPDSIPIVFKEGIKQKTKRSHYDILLVDDDLATIRLILSYFESKGYTCQGVLNGTKALEELKTNIPKVILTDIIHPGPHGYDLCKQIKSNPKWKDISIFFCTAVSGSEVEKHLTETKADGYILKPFNFSDLDIILDLLNG